MGLNMFCCNMFVDIVVLCASLCYAFVRLHHVVTHTLYVGLIFCHGKPKDPYHLLKLHTWGTAPPNAQVRRDNFSGSRVRKCVHIMHRIIISTWHHNEHIVPAFVRYHIPILHESLHHQAYAFNILFVIHVYSCVTLAFSSAKQ